VDLGWLLEGDVVSGVLDDVELGSPSRGCFGTRCTRRCAVLIALDDHEGFGPGPNEVGHVASVVERRDPAGHVVDVE
jgi:hypothetical protein